MGAIRLVDQAVSEARQLPQNNDELDLTTMRIENLANTRVQPQLQVVTRDDMTIIGVFHPNEDIEERIAMILEAIRESEESDTIEDEDEISETEEISGSVSQRREFTREEKLHTFIIFGILAIIYLLIKSWF